MVRWPRQAMKPLNSKGPILATAENRETVAVDPLVEVLEALTLR